MSLGIYIHIPFCLKKCPYCDFSSFSYSPIPEERYVCAVINEIKKSVNLVTATVDSIYFGGGTPSLFSHKSINAMISAISDRAAISDNAEITLEANPGTIGKEKLHDFLSAGINRLSMGVQSFDNKNLLTLGRIHSADDAVLSYLNARKAGFENIGLDLIFGIPNQTLDQWESDLHQAIKLGPKHISVYNLTLEKSTPFFKWVKEGKLLLPEDEIQVSMFSLAHDLLGKAGYDHYEISNYARPGFLSVHNTGYWEHRDYLGFGAGAHSFQAPLRWWNIADPMSYISASEKDDSLIEEKESLSEKQIMAERLWLGLRMTKGISLTAFPPSFLDMYRPSISNFIGDGWLFRDHDTLKLTPRGVLISDCIFTEFMGQ